MFALALSIATWRVPVWLPESNTKRHIKKRRKRNGGCTSSPASPFAMLVSFLLFFSIQQQMPSYRQTQWQYQPWNGTPDLTYIWLEPFTDKIWDMLCIFVRGTLFLYHDPLKHALLTTTTPSKELHLLCQLHYQFHIQWDYSGEATEFDLWRIKSLNNYRQEKASLVSPYSPYNLFLISSNRRPQFGPLAPSKSSFVCLPLKKRHP